jgi:hypothetical protein
MAFGKRELQMGDNDLHLESRHSTDRTCDFRMRKVGFPNGNLSFSGRAKQVATASSSLHIRSHIATAQSVACIVGYVAEDKDETRINESFLGPEGVHFRLTGTH